MSAPKRSEEFVVKVGERIGAAADLFAKLREAGVNVLASCCYQIGGEAHLSFVPEDRDHAEEALRDDGLQPERQEVLLVELTHETGSFATLLQEIGAVGVNIRSAYVTATSSTRATAVVKTDENDRVLAALAGAKGAAPRSAAEAVDEPGSAAEAVDEPGSAAEAVDEPGSATEAVDEPGSAAEAVDEPGSAAEAVDEPGSAAKPEPAAE